MFEKLLRRMASELKRSGLPYMIIGGQAVLLYGTPRLTNDIDVTLGVDISAIDGVVEIISRIGLRILPEDFRSFIEKTFVLPTRDEKSGIRVDFIFSFTPYERRAIPRAKEVSLRGVVVMFASIEDVIIHKIFAGRPRDLEDVRSMILKNPDIDKIYIEQWLMEFESSPEKKGLLKAFEEILTE